jgi:hypothetical protein
MSDQCGVNGKECSVGLGIPSKSCPISKYLMGCPIVKAVDQSSIHACPRKELCKTYRREVTEKDETKKEIVK